METLEVQTPYPITTTTIITTVGHDDYDDDVSPIEQVRLTLIFVGIVTIIKAFYKRKISFLAGWLLIVTTQVLGYGWAGLLRKYVVEPAHMWWPSTLVQVSLFR
ncbi:Oligopeptide transporter 4 [Camellia lanceoleosa]|uniref:Oligopeptide transporter 4 n=1 Tax=Camellia lanceoleosa TaxID=1840588 RepID=A0ACC0FXF1_9ERIC|nr:Oligopeptide transporter 4 [Camellia lanceoleosa]